MSIELIYCGSLCQPHIAIQAPFAKSRARARRCAALLISFREMFHVKLGRELINMPIDGLSVSTLEP